MKKRLTTACALLFLMVPASRAEVHTWTNLEGQKLEAEMVGMDVATKSVQLKRADGQVFAIPISRLSPEDVSYAATRWRTMQSQGGAPIPTVAASSGTLNLSQLPPRFVSRCSEQTRLAQVLKHGGTPECEASVTKSLDWLKAEQKPNGSWSTLANTGYTGFVLQCFTARCEGVDSAKYGDAVMKGTLFLIETAKANPFGIVAIQPKNSGAAYEHGIATTALGEVYLLARAGSAMPPGLRETFEKAVDVILKNQGQTGSWDYYPAKMIEGEAPSTREDLSVTNWQLQALLVAREAGLRLPALEPCIAKSLRYLEAEQTRAGGFGNENSDAHYNQWHMSGGAILGLQTLSNNNTSKTGKGIRFLREYLTKEPMNWDSNCNLYSWVSYTPAFFNAGGDDWKFYSAQLLPQILKAQESDGGFRAGKASWPASAAADRIYRQALCTLQLQVFYRYLK